MTSYSPAPVPTSAWWWVFTLLMAALMAFVLWVGARTLWGMSTLRYELTAEELRIPYGPTVTAIPRSDIRKGDLIPVTGGIRTGGTGLPNLQHGKWSFRETGRIRMFSTTTRPLLVLETDTEKYGISPDDPLGFLAALHAGQTGTFAPVRRPLGFGGYLFVLLMLTVPIGTAALLMYLPRVARTMRYALEPDQLEIHCGFSRVRIPYAAIDEVRHDSPRGTPWKTTGAWLPGLYWGAFAWSAAGPGLRMYATHDKPIVLIRAGGRTYGITPAEAPAFVEDLRRRLP